MLSKRKSNQRLESTKKYIDDLSSNYSKLNFVKPDLSYTKEHSQNITLEQANKDFKKLLNNTRSKPTVFNGLVGYIVKREYTEEKGVHFHPMFIYDGQKVREDITKADQIGEYWKNNITKGNGLFHNCNKNDYKDKGIGILEYQDSEKRKILNENVLPYLCKEDQSIEPLKENKKDKAFTRGIAPKNKENRGRPRNEK